MKISSDAATQLISEALSLILFLSIGASHFQGHPDIVYTMLLAPSSKFLSLATTVSKGNSGCEGEQEEIVFQATNNSKVSLVVLTSA